MLANIYKNNKNSLWQLIYDQITGKYSNSISYMIYLTFELVGWCFGDAALGASVTLGPGLAICHMWYQNETIRTMHSYENDFDCWKCIKATRDVANWASKKAESMWIALGWWKLKVCVGWLSLPTCTFVSWSGEHCSENHRRKI